MSMAKKLTKKAHWSIPVEPRASKASGHQYIKIGKYHRNPANAEAYVLDLFRQVDPSTTASTLKDQVIRADKGNGQQFVVTFHDAFQDARTTGTAASLRTYLNASDPYFVFTLAIAMDGEGITTELGFAGQKKALAAPMRQGAIEAELTDDVLEHRRRASRDSVKGHDQFQSTSMHFRGYLLSSCALVEAFLNRCILLDAAKGRTSNALQELQKPGNIERRFELWLEEFCGEPISVIKGTVEWDHFSELRRLRNSLMHATDSMLGIGLKETTRQLNLVRHGVGGMVNLLRKTQQLPPVPFAESLETAPECTFESEVR